ncbi:hypothetical protein ACWGLE_08045 [Streptomyces sp. NPDC055897]
MNLVVPDLTTNTRGTTFGGGWDDAVDRTSEVLVSTGDSTYRQRGRREGP